MSKHILGKVALLSFGWSAIGGIVSISLGATIGVSSIVACIAAVIAGYSYGPKAVNQALVEKLSSKQFYVDIYKVIVSLILAVLFIVAYYTSLIAPLLLAKEEKEINFIFDPFCLAVFSGIALGVMCIFHGDMKSFKDAALVRKYGMPLQRLTSRCFGSMFNLTIKHNIGLALFVIFSPYIISAYVIVSIFMLAIDIPLTILMVTAKQARIAIMVGTLTGTLVASLMHQAGVIESFSVLYGGITGAAVAMTSYALREVLVTVPIGLTPSFIKQ